MQKLKRKIWLGGGLFAPIPPSWIALKPCETLTRHIQNPTARHYSVIFRDIQNPVQCLHMQKPGILGILEYSEPFHNCISTYIQNPNIFTKTNKYSELVTYLKHNTYSESSQRLKVEFFAKIVKNYDHFSNVLNLRSLNRFWICLSLNKYSLTCRIPSLYILCDTYSVPCLLL